MPDRYLAKDRVRRIGCPEALKSKEENEWARDRGVGNGERGYAG